MVSRWKQKINSSLNKSELEVRIRLYLANTSNWAHAVMLTDITHWVKLKISPNLQTWFPGYFDF